MTCILTTQTLRYNTVFMGNVKSMYKRSPTATVEMWFECVPQRFTCWKISPSVAELGGGGTFQRWILVQSN